MSDVKQIVIDYLEIFFGASFIPEQLLPLLANNFCFKGPLMTADSAEEFLMKLKMYGNEISMTAEIHQIIGEGNSIVAIYDFILPNGTRVPACEWYEIGDGKIAKMTLFCDPKLFLN